MEYHNVQASSCEDKPYSEDEVWTHVSAAKKAKTQQDDDTNDSDAKKRRNDTEREERKKRGRSDGSPSVPLSSKKVASASLSKEDLELMEPFGQGITGYIHRAK